MPPSAGAAGKRARGKRNALQISVGLGLFVIAVAAIAGPIEKVAPTFSVLNYALNVASVCVFALFAAAALLRLYRMRFRPEEIWYHSRSIAEGIKSVSWRYAVGGNPIGIKSPPAEGAEKYLSTLLTNYEKKAQDEGVQLPVTSTGDDGIPLSMITLRGNSLANRVDTYDRERIEEQREYYRTRARAYVRWARFWNLFAIGVEIIGAGLAVIKVFGWLQVDLYGIAATVVAAGGSWLQLNQYTRLAQNYDALERQLGRYHSMCIRFAKAWPEEQWASFVAEVEDLLEAEHANWQQVVRFSAFPDE
jgi:hypothetical protein